MVWQANHLFPLGVSFVRTCRGCGEDKELEAFGFRNKAAGRRHQKCRACVAEYGRAHYERNRQEYITRSACNMRVRRRALKEKVWCYLAENPCVDCGEADPLVLEFDHIDPENKLSEIYSLVQNTYRWNSILAEIERCQVRCANCHRRRTALQFAWPKLAFAEGDWLSRSASTEIVGRRRLRQAGPPRNRVTSVETLTPLMIAAGLRSCAWCGKTKSAEEVHLTDKATGRRHSSCAACFNAY